MSLTSAALLGLGCGHEDDRHAVAATNSRPADWTAEPRPVKTTGPRPLGLTNVQADTSVVDRIANARCDREQACDNVGNGKKYAAQNVCRDQMRGGLANDLNPHECPGGIDSTALRACLTAIGSEECGAHPVEAITRLDRCRSGALCMK